MLRVALQHYKMRLRRPSVDMDAIATSTVCVILTQGRIHGGNGDRYPLAAAVQKSRRQVDKKYFLSVSECTNLAILS